MTVDWNAQCVIGFEYKYNVASSLLDTNVFVVDGSKQTLAHVSFAFSMPSTPLVEWLLYRNRAPSSVEQQDEITQEAIEFESIEDQLRVVVMQVESSSLAQAISERNKNDSFPLLAQVNNITWISSGASRRSTALTANTSVALQMNRADFPSSFSETLSVAVQSTAVGSSEQLVSLMTVSSSGLLSVNDLSLNMDTHFIDLRAQSIPSSANSFQLVMDVVNALGDLVTSRTVFESQTSSSFTWRLSMPNAPSTLSFYLNTSNPVNIWNTNV